MNTRPRIQTQRKRAVLFLPFFNSNNIKNIIVFLCLRIAYTDNDREREQTGKLLFENLATKRATSEAKKE